MTNKIEFKFSIEKRKGKSLEEELEIDYLFCEVQLLIDGKKILTSNPTFDFSKLAAVLDTECFFHPYTCNCGVAGCADIHEEVKLTTDNNYIYWELPEHYFRSHTVEGFFEQDKPMILKFEKQQYLSEISNTIIELFKSYERNKDLPIVILPSYDPPGHAKFNFENYFRKNRETFLEWNHREKRRETLYGDLLKKTILVNFQNEEA